MKALLFVNLSHNLKLKNMTYQQIINNLPLNVTAKMELKTAQLSNGVYYFIKNSPSINVGRKFNITSVTNFSGGVMANSSKVLVTDIPSGNGFLGIVVNINDASIYTVTRNGSMTSVGSTPFDSAIKVNRSVVKNISNKYTEISSSIDGGKQKYKVVKGGFNYNGNVLKVGEIFEGADTGAKFLDSPAITITYLGQPVNVPKDNLLLVDDQAQITDTNKLETYNKKRSTIKSITKVAGLGGGLFLAHKMKKGTWGYIGFGLLGIIAGTFVGGQISNVLIKD